MNIAVTGATGQMGSNVIKVARDRGENISAAFDREESESRGLEVRNDDELRDVLEQGEIDVLVDFTVPEASMKYLEAAEASGTPIVIGTTGFSDEEEARIRKVGEVIPVLKASNFSPSINVMRELIKEASGKLEDYDIEVSETHHNRKRDAPSGTAENFLDDVREVREEFEEVHGREGEQPRSEGEVGVHAKRAGDIRGSHEILLAGNDEVLKIRHRSESREVFASGALKAAEWLKRKDEGFYGFGEVLE